jgi:hypothetical protein
MGQPAPQCWRWAKVGPHGRSCERARICARDRSRRAFFRASVCSRWRWLPLRWHRASSHKVPANAGPAAGVGRTRSHAPPLLWRCRSCAGGPTSSPRSQAPAPARPLRTLWPGACRSAMWLPCWASAPSVSPSSPPGQADRPSAAGERCGGGQRRGCGCQVMRPRLRGRGRRQASGIARRHARMR